MAKQANGKHTESIQHEKGQGSSGSYLLAPVMTIVWGRVRWNLSRISPRMSRPAAIVCFPLPVPVFSFMSYSSDSTEKLRHPHIIEHELLDSIVTWATSMSLRDCVSKYRRQNAFVKM
jgi:hypothetical protein